MTPEEALRAGEEHGREREQAGLDGSESVPDPAEILETTSVDRQDATTSVSSARSEIASPSPSDSGATLGPSPQGDVDEGLSGEPIEEAPELEEAPEAEEEASGEEEGEGGEAAEGEGAEEEGEEETEEGRPRPEGGGEPAGLDLADMEGLAAGDLDLIDTELAEHQRWAGARAEVGTAMSAERAAYVLGQITEGFMTGAAGGAGMGLSLGLLHRGLATRAAARVGGRLAARMGGSALARTGDAAQAAARMAARMGTRLGPRVAAQTARFTPLPAIGAVVGGVISFHSLYTRDWRQSLETISNIGEGGSTYEKLANSIAAISEMVDVVSNILNVVAGILGIITVALWIAAVVSAGALSPLAGTLTAISLAIGVVTLALDAINMIVLQPSVTLFRALHAFTSDADPREVVADGRQLSAAAANNGGALGGLLGARAANIGGARPAPDAPDSTTRGDDTPPPAAGEGPRVDFEARPQPPDLSAAPVRRSTEAGPAPSPEAPTTPRAEIPEAPATPRPATPEAPPAPRPPSPETPAISRPAAAETPTTPRPETPAAPAARPARPGPNYNWVEGYVRADGTPVRGHWRRTGRTVPAETPAASSSPAARPDAPVPEQLTLPGTEATPRPPVSEAASPPAGGPPAQQPAGGGLRAITAPLRLEAFKGTESIPQGLEPGSIGTYARAVDQPPAAALASNPPGAPGATRGGGRMPQSGRQDAGVYYEHQTSAAVAHEVLPGHQYESASGRRRGGRDVVDALVMSLPEEVKPIIDQLDATHLADVRARLARGEDVPLSEIVVRGAEHTQTGVAQAQADVPGTQVSQLFLGEMEQFQGEQFGYREVPIGSPLPEGHPFRDASEAELSGFIDRQFDPFLSEPAPVPPPGTQLPLPGMEGAAPPAQPEQLSLPITEMRDPNQLTLPFHSGPVSEAAHPAAGSPAPATAPTAAEAAPEQVDLMPASGTGRPTTDETGAGRPLEPGASTSSIATSAATASAANRPAPGSEPSLLQTFFPILSAGAHGPSPEEQQEAFNAQFTSDFPPIEGVERANPDYPEPPCTPAQIDAIRGHITELRGARAQTQHAQDQMDAQIEVHEANEEPLNRTIETTEAGVSATEQHEEKVESTADANEQQQERQSEVNDAVGEYDDRSGAIDGLRTPLRAFRGMMHLASYLPGRAGRAMADMDRDAGEMLSAFDEMDASMAEQQDTGSISEEQLQSEGAEIEGVSIEAESTHEELTTAVSDATEIGERNADAIADATERRTTAEAASSRLDDQIEEQESTAETLTQELQSWAQQHRDARMVAVDATRAKVGRLDLTVTGVHTE